ncbi:MAG: DUF4296 domain-containing protein [bacterium]
MRYLLWFLSLFLLVGCQTDPKQEEDSSIAADSLIPESEMILILADFHYIEAALQIRRNRGEDASEQAGYYYAGLFRKYHISRQRYQQNLEYYRRDPEVFIKLYEKVNQELVDREKKFVKKIHD